MAGTAGKIIWLAGASGMVGAQVLEALLREPEFARVLAITRRPLGRDSLRLANRIVPFAQLEEQLRGQTCDAALCCLGGGADAQAGVLAYARAARSAGARRFVMLSCRSADPRSRSPAARVLGQTLDALAAMNFESLDILLPGPLLGLRRGATPGQLCAMAVAALVRPLQLGAAASQRAIGAALVAAAMVAAARSGRRGLYRYDYAAIRTLSGKRDRT